MLFCQDYSNRVPFSLPQTVKSRFPSASKNWIVPLPVEAVGVGELYVVGDYLCPQSRLPRYSCKTYLFE